MNYLNHNDNENFLLKTRMFAMTSKNEMILWKENGHPELWWKIAKSEK